MNARLPLFCLLLCGCSTISPNLPLPMAPSAGPNGMHSGVYARSVAPDGSIRFQWWYPQDRAAYNTLIGLYGTQFTPPLAPDDHLTADGAYWKADGTAITHYAELQELAGQKPAP